MKRDCWSKFELSSELKVSKNKVENGLSALSVCDSNQGGRIIADSGASIHLTRNIEWFSSLHKLDMPLVLNIADGKNLKATHIGDIEIEKSIDGKKWEKRIWESVYYSKDMSNESLFSTTFMEKTKGYSFYHGNGNMRLMNTQKIVLGGKRIGNQYIPFIRVKPPMVSVNVVQSVELWHQRLGHVNDNVIRAMVNNELVDGLQVSLTKRENCDSCHYGKQTINSHPSRERRSCLPGERFHSDVCHVGITSWNKYKYFLTMKDEASGYRRVFFLKTKDEVSNILRLFFVEAEKETGRKAISLRTDNGTEYINEKVKEVLMSMGIDHELSPPYVKQCNGMAERENRSLCDTARSLLFNTDFSKVDRQLLWTEAIETAAYLRNRVPNRGLVNTTPYREWYGKKPDISHLRVFGAKAFVHIPGSMRSKMDSKSRKAVFVGYDRQTNKVYRVFDPEKKIVERVSNVVIEDTSNMQVLFPIVSDEIEEESEEMHVQELIPDITVETEDKDDKVFEDSTDEMTEETELNKPKKKIGRPPGSKNFENPILLSDRKLRTRSDRSDLSDKPDKSAHIAAMKSSLDPTCFEDVVSRDDAHLWKRAMEEEMSSLIKNQTWELEKLPEGKSTVSCRWIFKSKLQPNGTIERYKARLVARGFNQTQGVDYFDTFSPVVRYESVRTVLAIVSKYDMEMMQFDIKTAFLNGPLKEDIYMQQPKGFEDGTDRVCHLKNGLYGLKQASRNWNDRFNGFMNSYGLIQSESDPCVFVKGANTDDWMILCLYVDDGLVACKQKNKLAVFISSLKNEFEAKCHEPSCYVGIEISRDREKKIISINQQGYISRMLHRFGMENCKSASSPTDPSVKLTGLVTKESSEKRFPYREAIGSLNYVSIISRPDISFTVNTLARFSNNPHDLHWKGAKRIMQYLKRTINLSLCFGGEMEDCLVGFCDSDYAGELCERKSTSGYVFMFNGGPVAWSSSLQRISALSSCEAEYISISEALKELLWLRPLIESIGIKQMRAIDLKVDNQAAIAMSKNPEFHKRSKHIGVRFHRVRQEQESGNVNVNYVPSNKQIADLLTKPLGWPTISRYLKIMNMTFRTRGGVENSVQ